MLLAVSEEPWSIPMTVMRGIASVAGVVATYVLLPFDLAINRNQWPPRRHPCHEVAIRRRRHECPASEPAITVYCSPH